MVEELIRPAQFSGLFYPEEPETLSRMVNDFLNYASVKKIKKTPRALIVPHAGYNYSGPIAAYGYKIIKDLQFKKIILLGPSHHFALQELAAANFKFWQTPLGKIESLTLNDFELLKKEVLIKPLSEVHLPEHCLEVQLPFLQMVMDNFQIFPILTDNGNFENYAKILNKIIDKDTILIVSSDLSHYLPYQEAQRLDKVTIDAILANDIERFEQYGEACGKGPIKILLSLAQLNHWEPLLLFYANSGDTSGDKERVVGYASLVFS